MSDSTLSHDEGNQPGNSSADILLNTATGTANMQNVSTNGFWQSFHVFSSQFEKWCIRHWYWLLTLFYITLIPIYILIDVSSYSSYYDLYHVSHWDFWSYFFSSKSYTGHFLLSWWYNLFVIGMFAVLPIFYVWQNKIPDIFQTLQQKYIIFDSQQGSATSSEEFQRFLDQYQCAILYGRKRLLTRSFITGGVVFLTSILLLFWWIMSNLQDLRDKAIQYNLFFAALFGFKSLVQETLYTLLLVYLAVQILWVLTTTGVYLTKLIKRFQLLIQPAHIDHCGGLKFLGDFSLNMALTILVASVLLALYSTSYGYSFWSIGTSVTLAMVLLLAYFVFFAPLKEIHRQMLKARRPYEEALVTSTTKAVEKLRLALSEGDPVKIKTAKEEVEMIQALHPDKMGYATWPINRNTLLAFFAPQVVPVISFVVGLSPSLSEALKGILSIFSGGK